MRERVDSRGWSSFVDADNASRFIVDVMATSKKESIAEGDVPIGIASAPPVGITGGLEGTMGALSRRGSALVVAGGDAAGRSAELLLGGELAVNARSDDPVRVGSALWYAMHSRAQSTIRSYEGSWRRVKRMCQERGICPLPMAPADAADLIAAMADERRAFSTIRGVCNVIRLIHRAQNLADPTATAAVQSVKRGISGELGFRKVKRKFALEAPDMRAAAARAAARPWPRGIQEWAALSFTWACGFRRGEAVQVDIDDLDIGPDAMRVVVVKSKTDQCGRGDIVTIERNDGDRQMCAVAAVEAWLAALGEDHGPLFRSIRPGCYIGGRLSDRTVARWVQAYAPWMGLRPADVGGHSLRAGCVTELLRKGVDELEVAAHTRHASLESLKIYDRPRERRTNIAKALMS